MLPEVLLNEIYDCVAAINSWKDKENIILFFIYYGITPYMCKNLEENLVEYFPLKLLKQTSREWRISQKYLIEHICWTRLMLDYTFSARSLQNIFNKIDFLIKEDNTPLLFVFKALTNTGDEDVLYWFIKKYGTDYAKLPDICIFCNITNLESWGYKSMGVLLRHAFNIEIDCLYTVVVKNCSSRKFTCCLMCGKLDDLLIYRFS